MYYEISPDSPAYRKICDSLMDYARWHDDEIREKICQLLSVQSTEGIYFCTGRLIMDNPPARLMKQFEGPNKRGQYAALESSNINKLWAYFCRINNLRFIRPLDILDFDFDLIEYTGKKVFYPLGARFFIESEVEMKRGFLKAVSEKEFQVAMDEFRARLKKTA